MEGLDYWRLCDEVSVVQAALLLLGRDPGEGGASVEDWAPHEQPTGYEAVKSAIRNAILGKRLPATIRRSAWERGWDEEPGDGEGRARLASMLIDNMADRESFQANARSIASRGVIYRTEPNWHLTTIHVEHLREWLMSRGIHTGFFFPTAIDEPNYLDPKNPRYAPKLAAAVKAWRAVTDPGGRHPKQALMKWLREHAADFGLSDEEGKPNETGIEEVAKVANWRPGGGAAKTPGE